jgi:2,4-dienoyl-CoA reductase (NADPH2)
VVVIGSGPAGMETARVAAERGHHVTLFERNSQTGGALLWASILHPENQPFLRWLRDEVGRSSVKVELGHEVSVDDILELHPDAVVVANGGQVIVPAIAGSDLPHVQTGQALRERFGGWRQRLVRPKAVRVASKAWLPMGHRVVIVGADLVALELAEFLAARGRFVSVLEADKTIAPELGNKRKTEHMDRLDRLGVAVHVRALVDEIVPDGVVFTPYGGSSRQLAADTVVIAGTMQPNTELYEKLVAALPNAAVHAAGDCTGLGLIRKATEDGARAACAI